MVNKVRVGRFLRALLGLLTVSWLLAALVAPPDPFTFLLLLVPGWLLAVLGALWLVYAGGYEVLRESAAYTPRAPAARATAAFVVLTLASKLALTFGGNLLFGRATVGYGEGLLTSAMAVVVAYVLVFWAGVLGGLGNAGSERE